MKTSYLLYLNLVLLLTVPPAADAGDDQVQRTTLSLDAVTSAVLAANPRTVVVVNSGAPVLMPWADEVDAILYAWLPGQAMGEALADVLFGDAEPGGRLPVTLPAAEADCPVLHFNDTIWLQLLANLVWDRSLILDS